MACRDAGRGGGAVDELPRRAARRGPAARGARPRRPLLGRGARRAPARGTARPPRQQRGRDGPAADEPSAPNFRKPSVGLPRRPGSVTEAVHGPIVGRAGREAQGGQPRDAQRNVSPERCAVRRGLRRHARPGVGRVPDRRRPCGSILVLSVTVIVIASLRVVARSPVRRASPRPGLVVGLRSPLAVPWSCRPNARAGPSALPAPPDPQTLELDQGGSRCSTPRDVACRVGVDCPPRCHRTDHVHGARQTARRPRDYSVVATPSSCVHRLQPARHPSS